MKSVVDKKLNKKRRRHSIIAFEMIRLDRAAAEPLHQQLYRQIRDELIQVNVTHNSSRLPSSRELAADLGVSRLTVNLALSKLHSEGYLQSRVGSGTFVAQPLPENLEGNMSAGYLAATQGARPFEFVTASPAGALSATATDMTRLMLALLGEGTLEGATILKPETVRAMETRQFELHPDLHAIGFILMDYSMNGQRVVGHGGDTIYFHSDMILMPDARIGLFISYNSAGSRPGSGR